MKRCFSQDSLKVNNSLLRDILYQGDLLPARLKGLLLDLWGIHSVIHIQRINRWSLLESPSVTKKTYYYKMPVVNSKWKNHIWMRILSGRPDLVKVDSSVPPMLMKKTGSLVRRILKVLALSCQLVWHQERMNWPWSRVLLFKRANQMSIRVIKEIWLSSVAEALQTPVWMIWYLGQ